MMETNLETLQSELDYYRQNQNAVEEEIRSLIADNQKLSQQVGALMKEKLDVARQEHRGCEQDRETEELRRKVALLAKERDSLHVLWQTSQKTIEALETELKTYQSYDDNRGMQNIHEDKKELEIKLEASLTEYIELETKFKQLSSKYNQLENEDKSKDRLIMSYNERGKVTAAKLEELTKSLEQYRIELASERKRSEDLKSQLLLCQKESVDIVKREAEAKAKVAEALQLFDVVSAQKHEAYKKIAEVTGELSQVKQHFETLKRDEEKRFRKELEEIKEKYNEKVTDMLQHIRNLDSELVEKGMLLHKVLRENEILQKTNENYLKEQKDGLKRIDPRLALAEQRLEIMYQELVSSERRNIQLVCEKQSLAIDIQRIQDTHMRETKRRDWEEKLLKTQCDELKLQVEHLQKSLDETHEMINKLQTMLSSKNELNQRVVSTKEEEVNELNKHLHKQMELSKKWKESYVDMTEKLKKRLEQMQIENNELKSKSEVRYPETCSQHSTSS